VRRVLDFGYDPPERNPGKPWKWMLIDSAVIAGIAFVSVLPADRLPNIFDAYVAVKAFLYAFLVQIAIERGLKPRLKNNENENNE
jgi:hypothetical protein